MKASFRPVKLGNLNPLSPESDFICEQIYKKVCDQNGHLHERFARVCELVDVDPHELVLR